MRNILTNHILSERRTCQQDDSENARNHSSLPGNLKFLKSVILSPRRLP